MVSEMAVFLPNLTLLLVVLAAVGAYGCVYYVGQEPDASTGKRYGWSLAEQRPCECTEFRLGGVNMKPQIKPYEVKICQNVRSPEFREDQHACINNPLRKVPGSLKHVSIGGAGVWGVGVHDDIYHKARPGYSWTIIPGELEQLDVGTNAVWGVNSIGRIYYREVSVSNPRIVTWSLVQGWLKCVSVSQKGHVWGVNQNTNIYHRKNASVAQIAGSSWVHISGSLKQISIGSGGVWGISQASSTFYREGTYGDPDTDPDGSSWIGVGPSIKYVSSGDVIYVVDTNDVIYYRVGTSAQTPTGTAWEMMAGNLRQIESFANTFWGVDATNTVYTNESLIHC